MFANIAGKNRKSDNRISNIYPDDDYICGKYANMKLKTPTLLLDKQKCLANFHRMKAKAEKHGLIFRPHFKTHQSIQVGRWFRELRINKITVSSVTMARYFAGDGWDDITIAFPVNPAEVEDIRELADRARINVLVENREGIDFLKNGPDHALGVFIKIDAGYQRTGVDADDHETILSLIGQIQKQPGVSFKGFIVHNGHTYHASGPAEIAEIHEQALQKISGLRSAMEAQQIEAVYSFGDTPAISQTEQFDNINEIRPGNFVFYDVMQENLGACRFEDIAVALACPVVAKHVSRHEIVVYGGAVHLSKDSIVDRKGQSIYGRIVNLTNNGWGDPVENTYVKSLSQEHGIIKASAAFFQHINIGDFIGILPVHSCLTVSAMPDMITLDGEKLSNV